MADDARTYGMPVERDPEGRARDGDPGEAPKHVADPHPEFTHGLPGEGRTILVEEASGVAFAEVTGAAGVHAPAVAQPEARPEPEPAPVPEPPVAPPPVMRLVSDRPPARPVVTTGRAGGPDVALDAAIAFGVLAFAGLAAAVRRRRRAGASSTNTAAAFARPAPDAINFAQVRDAGPGAMRDAAAPAWDPVDEASDESFPASDPPANY